MENTAKKEIPFVAIVKTVGERHQQCKQQGGAVQSVAKSAHGFKIVDHVIVILKIINTVFKSQTSRKR